LYSFFSTPFYGAVDITAFAIVPPLLITILNASAHIALQLVMPFSPACNNKSALFSCPDFTICVITIIAIKENMTTKAQEPNCINLSGQTKIQHVAYLIKNAIMHVGADSFAAHIASGYDKKILAVYSNNNINNVKPYWTKVEDMVLLEPERLDKPNYSAEETPKTINNIKQILARSYLCIFLTNFDNLNNIIMLCIQK
jgi:hypothetical protein